MSDYKKDLFKKGLRCKHCGKPVDDRNKTGSCAHCRMTIDQRGAGNHMYGKKFSKEELEKYADITRQLWRNPEYRKKVIANATGLHRSNEFKKGQSVRTKASYDKIKGLRELRGKTFSQSWKNGLNKVHHFGDQKSPLEKSLYEKISNWGYNVEVDKKIFYGENKWYRKIPDFIVEGDVIVELYGDYFHGNPLKFKEDDVIAYGQIAKDIWERDAERERLLTDKGFHYLVVWEKDLKEDRETTLNTLRRKIKELKGY